MSIFYLKKKNRLFHFDPEFDVLPQHHSSYYITNTTCRQVTFSSREWLNIVQKVYNSH